MIHLHTQTAVVEFSYFATKLELLFEHSVTPWRKEAKETKAKDYYQLIQFLLSEVL